MKFSSASTYDYIALSAQMRALYSGRYNCDEKIETLRSRLKRYPKINIDERIEKYRISRGCGKVVPRIVDQIGNVKFNTCLCSIRHPLFSQMQTITDFYNKGGLPFEGSLLSQPAQVMELIEIMNCAMVREKNELRSAQNG